MRIPVLSMAIIAKMRWFYNRFRCMSFAEIGYRFKQLVVSRAFKYRLLTAGDGLPDRPEQSAHWLPAVDSLPGVQYKAAADLLSSGKMPVFAFAEAEAGPALGWNVDPLTGVEAPLDFGMTLDYRDASLVGNIKYLWEPNRHLQLVWLAQAYYLDGEKKYLLDLSRQITSWLDQCPYLKGPNWTSSLELGIRLINWSLIWQLIGGDRSELFAGDCGGALKKRWLASIHQHTHFIHNHYSKFSSANNHLIGEAAGLYIASRTWPFWCDLEHWGGKARQILVSESARQNTEDGVNREQAFSYQQFVLDFLILSGLAGRNTGDEFDAPYWSRIEAMIGFIGSIMDVNGTVPMVGDADDGYVTALHGLSRGNPFRSLLATGAVLFGRPDFREKTEGLDNKTLWLLGSELCDRFERIGVGTTDRHRFNNAFKQGGYYLLGHDFEAADECRILADAGPLGYLSIAGHGHADALSFWMSVGGVEMLIDPGTYCYHSEKKWRDYFRGTSAHNTVRVDNRDQSEIGGNFMWLRKANVTVKHWSSGVGMDRLIAEHDGYGRLDDPLIHRRAFKLDKDHRVMRITDTFSCHRQHSIERFWHCAPGCRLTQRPAGVKLVRGDRQLMLEDLANDCTEHAWFSGEDGTGEILGWVSNRFDVKEPISTIRWRTKISGTSQLGTEIRY